MKCPFCGFENPAYANFCMNCGAPQDLKACGRCGTVNQKNATQCHGCGSGAPSKTPPAKPSTPVSVPHSYAEEAEALAKETQTFKRLLTELEEEVKQQNSELKTFSSQEETSVVAKAPHVSGRETNVPSPRSPSMIVETPAYLQQLLSEREVKKMGNSGWRLLILFALLLAACIVGYYGFA
jgi:hypothetical protein